MTLTNEEKRVVSDILKILVHDIHDRISRITGFEGGYFTETYVSNLLITSPEYYGPRYACTAIYYLLEGKQFSSFHTMKSDELW